MMLMLMLTLWGCVSGQLYPGDYWQQQQQQQQPYHQGQQAYQPHQQQQQQQQPLGGPSGLQQQQQPLGGHNGLQQQQQPLGGTNGLQQQQQPLGGHNGLQQQQQPLGGPNGLQQQQPGGLSGFRPQQEQQGGYRPGAAPQPGARQGQQGFSTRPPYPGDDRQTTTPASASGSPFQSRLFGQFASAPGSPGAPNASGDGSVPAGQGQGPRDINGVLELEPHGAAKQPQPGTPDSQVFHTTGADQSLYAVDWSYPRARNAPASLVLKRWGGLSPPEYVAVYRLRGPAPAPASYSLAQDEVHHYPWDVARRHGPPRWRAPPRDEDFELLPAGMGLGHGLGHHGGNHQYMFRTL